MSIRPVAPAAVLLVSAVLSPACVQSQEVPPAEAQIAAAIEPLPEGMRDGATVLGYRDGAGQLEVLREGDGEMICVADDPTEDGFHVACYHESLEPFMARGRELEAEGVDRATVERVRRDEAESGELSMPEGPAALYSLTGESDDFDRSTGEVDGARPLYVLYVPWATPEEIGLPPEPREGEPWLMDPGEPWAHVMYVPEGP